MRTATLPRRQTPATLSCIHSLTEEVLASEQVDVHCSGVTENYTAIIDLEGATIAGPSQQSDKFGSAGSVSSEEVATVCFATAGLLAVQS